MDWGLARRMRTKESGRESPPSTLVATAAETTTSLKGCQESAPLRNLGPATTSTEKTLVATPQPESDRLTQIGQALGTPAFMSPEQAQGAIELLDERTDVFGLGAILCVILTGSAPYQGGDQESVFRRAALADLGDAFERLVLSCADPELVDICRQCLEADAAKRPAHAGIVASRISNFLTSVQEQLERARLERATAEFQAREERKRRRLAVGLTIIIVSVIVLGSALGIWYARDKAKRNTEAALRRNYLESEVSNAVNEAEQRGRELHERLQDERKAAELLSNPREWQRLVESAQDSLKRAAVLEAEGNDYLPPDLRHRVENLALQIEIDDRNRRLAADLDRIRLESTDIEQGQIRIQPAGPKLAKALRTAGYDILQGNPSDLAVQIRQSSIHIALVAALDFWAQGETDGLLRTRLLEVARGADPDPWRDSFRHPDVWDDRAKLQKFANQVDCAQHSPQLLTALGDRLRSRNGDALALFRRALLAHPGDFWLYFEFGITSRNPVEQAGAFRAALSIRPDSAVVLYNLGVVLQADRCRDEAASCYRRALELDPKSSGALNNLGLVLDEQGHRPEAMACYRRAIDCDSHCATAYINLGGSLKLEGLTDEAIACYRKALEIDPNSSAALNNLGGALIERGPHEQGISFLRKALVLAPDNAMAWCNLGLILRKQWKFAEALSCFRRGHEIGSREAGWTYPSAEWVAAIERLLGLEKKLAAAQRGESVTGNACEKLAFAEFCVAHQKDYALAARLYAEAFAKDSQLADDLSAGHRYRAACTAAKAASTAENGSDPGDTERRRLRNQALDWLNAERMAWSARMKENIIFRRVGARILQRWQKDPDLASVREEASLLKLTAEEQTAWRQFWAEVALLVDRP
jgi:tetratricopeptide (TPR) repeat protein